MMKVGLMNKNAFVLMPFDDPYNGYFEKIFKPALQRASFNVTRADDIFQVSGIMQDIVRSIQEADLILCEMSGKNPNVFYELGLAHSRGKPVILVSRKKEDIPFDLSQLRVILYDTEQADWQRKLSTQIRQMAKSVNDGGAPQNKVLADLVVTPLATDVGQMAEEIRDIRGLLDSRLPAPGDRAKWETAYEYYAERYGWGYDELRVSCTIDAKGWAIVEREVIVTAHRLLPQLEQFIHVDPVTAAGKLALNKNQIDFFSLTSGTEVNCGKIIALNDGWVVQVTFEPPVPPGGKVAFKVRENIGETYAINYTQQQLDAEDIKEGYFNWRIDRPTLHFRTIVHLPAGFPPTGATHYVIFPPLPKELDDARRLEEEETRLKLTTVYSPDSSGQQQCDLELDVSLPILGLMYMIRWDPLNNTK
jgi:nucleoside 2-deoxyribosyltransferase